MVENICSNMPLCIHPLPLWIFVIVAIVVDGSRELIATQLFMLELFDWSDDQINWLGLLPCPIFGIIKHLAAIVVAFLYCDRGQRAQKKSHPEWVRTRSTSNEKKNAIYRKYFPSIFFSCAHSSLYACARVRVSSFFYLMMFHWSRQPQPLFWCLLFGGYIERFFFQHTE